MEARSLSRSATIALVAAFAIDSAIAADRRNVYQSENWTVDELLDDGRFAGCSVRAEYPNGERVTLVLRGTDAISLSFAKSEGYRRGSRWSLQVFADKVRIYEGVAEAGVGGEARALVLASPTFFASYATVRISTLIGSAAQPAAA